MYTGKQCFICGRNGASDHLDKHHIFGGGLRSKSEKYGLYVYLCGYRCHKFGKFAAHQCKETAEMLHKYGQMKAMLEQGWSCAEYVAEFGKNHLSREELEKVEQKREPVPVPAGRFFITDDEALPY